MGNNSWDHLCVIFVEVVVPADAGGDWGAVVEVEWCGAASLLLSSPRSVQPRFVYIFSMIGCLDMLLWLPTRLFLNKRQKNPVFNVSF